MVEKYERKEHSRRDIKKKNCEDGIGKGCRKTSYRSAHYYIIDSEPLCHSAGEDTSFRFKYFK